LSHISTYRANIQVNPIKEGKKDATWDMLAEAIGAVADEHGGRVGDTVTDFFGRRTEVDFALHTPEFPNGLGVNVDRKTGEVEFVYDEYGRYRRVISSLCDEITQNYTALAVSNALQSMNYNVQYDEQEERLGERRVVIRGVL
jgi:hypothetical protein